MERASRLSVFVLVLPSPLRHFLRDLGLSFLPIFCHPNSFPSVKTFWGCSIEWIPLVVFSPFKKKTQVSKNEMLHISTA